MTAVRHDHRGAGASTPGARIKHFAVNRSALTKKKIETPLVIELGTGYLVCATSTQADLACPECVRLRWIQSRPTLEREALLDGSGFTRARRAPDPWAEAMLASAISACPSPGTVLHVDASTLTVTSHKIAASSDCPASQHRTRRGSIGRDDLADAVAGAPPSVAELHLPEAELVGSTVGVLSRHMRESWFSPVSVAATGTLRERSTLSWQTLTFGMNGHGATRGISRRLSLLEGLERHSGLRKRHDGPVRVATYQDISEEALDPAVFGCYPAEHFASDRNHLGHVPWSRDLEVSWVPGLDVAADRAVWVPQQMAYYLAPRAGIPQFVQDNSNGCAVGATLGDAFLRGALEAVERDAFLAHWYARRAMTRIRLTELSPRSHVMRARLDDAGFDIHLFDSRVDLRIPSVIAIATRRGGGPGGFAIGAGAALDPGDAIQTAMREAACNAPEMAAIYESDPEKAQLLWERPEDLERLEQHALMYSVPDAVSRLDFWLDRDTGSAPASEVFADWLGSEPLSRRGVEGEVGVLLAELGRRDLRPILVEQTAEELERLELHACRVLIPGLLPLDFGRYNERALSLARCRILLQDDAPINPLPHPFS